MTYRDKAIIINLTQHKATLDQRTDSVIDPKYTYRSRLYSQLNFESIPAQRDLEIRAAVIVQIALDVLADISPGNIDDCNERARYKQAVMIAGAPYLMPHLATALQAANFLPLFAFTERESTEREQDGVVKKTSIFRHLGFVPAIPV